MCLSIEVSRSICAERCSVDTFTIAVDVVTSKEAGRLSCVEGNTLQCLSLGSGGLCCCIAFSRSVEVSCRSCLHVVSIRLEHNRDVPVALNVVVAQGSPSRAVGRVEVTLTAFGRTSIVA